MTTFLWPFEGNLECIMPCTVTAGMYENNIQFAEKEQAGDWGLLRLVPQQTHLSASVSFYWGSPRMASSLRYAASHTSAYTRF